MKLETTPGNVECGIFWQIMRYRIRSKRQIMRPGAVIFAKYAAKCGKFLQNVRPLCGDFMQIVR